MLLPRITLALLIFAASLSAETPVNEAQLKGSFEGKIVTLHHFCSEVSQHFDSGGDLKSHCEPGPWTMYGKFLVKSVSVKHDKVRIEGTRVWVLFKGEPRVETLARSTFPLELDIDTSDNDNRKLLTALSKVFLVGKQSFVDDVPGFWKSVVAKELNLPEPPATDEEETPQSSKSNLPTRVRVSQGVMEGMLIRKVQPIYPDSAKWTRIKGQVVLSAVISKSGDLKNLRLIEPVGAGLDEAAYEGVKQWKYRPYALKGSPVEVNTQITVNFTLSR